MCRRQKYSSISHFLILILSIVLFICSITGCTYTDEEEKDDETLKIIQKYQLVIIYENNDTNPNIKIINSYKVKDDEEKMCIIKYIMNNSQYTEAKRTRTASSYLKEWKAHNALYDRNINKEQTKDVDLDEHGYNILYGLISLLE